MQLDGVKLVPVEDQAIAPAFARWSKNRPYAGHEPGKLGASPLGGCSRAMVYEISSTPKSNPMTESGFHATGMGSAVHLAINEELDREPPGALPEAFAHDVPFSVSIEVEGGEPLEVESEADLMWWPAKDAIEIVDIKTLAQYGFKLKVTEEGADRGNLLQVGMAMKAVRDLLDAEGRTDVEVHGRLVYILPSELKGRDRLDHKGDVHDFRANRYQEFTFDWPAVAPLVENEIRRLAKIRSYMDAGTPVPRTIPGATPPGATIVGYDENKRKGIWQHWTDEGSGPQLHASGQTWHCGYCDWLDECMSQLEEETNEEDSNDEGTED